MFTITNETSCHSQAWQDWYHNEVAQEQAFLLLLLGLMILYYGVRFVWCAYNRRNAPEEWKKDPAYPAFRPTGIAAAIAGLCGFVIICVMVCEWLFMRLC